MKTKMTSTEIKWIVNALNQDMVVTKNEMDFSEENSPVWALGELHLENIQSLKTKLMDFLESDNKTIYVQK